MTPGALPKGPCEVQLSPRLSPAEWSQVTLQDLAAQSRMMPPPLPALLNTRSMQKHLMETSVPKAIEEAQGTVMPPLAPTPATRPSLDSGRDDDGFQTPPRGSGRGGSDGFKTPPRGRVEQDASPRPSRRHRRDPETPPEAPRQARLHPLLQALHWRSVSKVADVLKEDPGAALFPFFDNSVEPPLVAAVRLQCGPDVIGVLLDHGADANAVDLAGRSPLAALAATGSRPAFFQEDCGAEHSRKREVAICLLNAGADPDMQDRNGSTPTTLAMSSGDIKLAEVLQLHNTMLAMRLLPQGIEGLPKDLVHAVFSQYLLPKVAEKRHSPTGRDAIAAPQALQHPDRPAWLQHPI